MSVKEEINAFAMNSSHVLYFPLTSLLCLQLLIDFISLEHCIQDHIKPEIVMSVMITWNRWFEFYIQQHYEHHLLVKVKKREKNAAITQSL